jgi:hypothetical protein
MTKSKKTPVAVQVAIITAIGTIIVALIGSCFNGASPNSQPTEQTPPQKITGLILDEQTRKPVVGAKVTLSNVPGFVDVPVYTTSEGTFFFNLFVTKNVTVRIRVDKDGYDLYDRDVDIIFDYLKFEEIRLTPHITEVLPELPTYTEKWTIGYFGNVDLEPPLIYQNVIRAEKNKEGGFSLKLDSAFEAARNENVPQNSYSVKITGKFPFKTGKYEFTCKHVEGCKIDVAGRVWLDVWWDSGIDSVARDVTEGTHSVDIEFYDITGQGSLEVYWRLVK